jgi:hypothetical protein
MKVSYKIELAQQQQKQQRDIIVIIIIIKLAVIKALEEQPYDKLQRQHKKHKKYI